MALSVTFLFWGALIGTLSLGQGCSPPEGGYKMQKAIPLEYKMLNSDVVVWGIPLRRENDRNFPGGEVYSVDFEARCFFKGGPLDENLRIHHLGKVPGYCEAQEVDVDKRYLAYLNRDGNGDYIPSFKPDNGSAGYLDEITVLCETVINYPHGYNEGNNKEQCPEPYDYDDCVPPPKPTTLPTPPPNASDPPLPPNDAAGQQGPGNQPGQGGDVPYEKVVNEDEKDPEDSGMTLTFSVGLLLCALFFAFLL